MNLVYGVDYDYIIESFYCEYKLDKDEIKRVVNDYASASTEAECRALKYELSQLYPEYNPNNISQLDPDSLPATIFRKIYFVQSPKGADGLPTIHYSLKEKMLSDLRATRGKVKKQLAQAEESGDHVGAIRYNAKQLAIKVVCNSEYGASNNEYFAHYDPDVASTVTFDSRANIGFLTAILESDLIYVDDQFINDNKRHIDLLSSIGCLSITPYTGTDDNIFINRRHSLARLFDANYNVICPTIYEIHIKPSTVVYQDTDSNYYTNKYIVDHFTDNYTKCSPEIIDSCMKCLVSHNKLIATFVRDSINRRPSSLSFEGSLVVCRYLNRKKKYYGIKWSEDGEHIPAVRLCPDAYINDILIPDYKPYWVPKKSVLPQPNGEYLYLDTDELLHHGANYLDYVHDYNVKCTGVDLARRDQYKYINYFHMMIVQKDLRLMKYDGDNNWSTFNINEPMQSIVESVIATFRGIIDCYTDISLFKSSKLPEIEFKAIDFAKTAAYRQGKVNAVTTIVKRLMSENKDKYIPAIGERMSYIVLINAETKNDRLNGKASDGKVANKSYVIDEIIDDIKNDISEDEYTRRATSAGLINPDKTPTIPYDTWINAKIISMIDTKYYFECLCKSTALYIIGDLYPEEIKRIDEGTISASEANKLVTKLQCMIAKRYVKQYFHYGVSLMTDYKNTLKSINKYEAQTPDDVGFLLKVYPSIRSTNEITIDKRNFIIDDAKDKINTFSTLYNDMEYVYKYIMTNSFTKFVSENQKQQKLYDKYKNDPDKLLGQLEIHGKRLAGFKNVKRIAEKITFK